VYVPSKAKLGEAVGIEVSAASACIIKGEAGSLIKEITERVEQV